MSQVNKYKKGAIIQCSGIHLIFILFLYIFLYVL